MSTTNLNYKTVFAILNILFKLTNSIYQSQNHLYLVNTQTFVNLQNYT